MPPLSLRIPYTEPLPPPKIIPSSASTFDGAVAALTRFLLAPAPAGIKPHHHHRQALHAHHQHVSRSSHLPNDNFGPNNPPAQTLLLTGAGISVASGLADYRGDNGTYRLNRKYKPVFFHEFCQNHEARKRYWARSFLGWEALRNKKPNAAHHAVAKLGGLGMVGRVITQNVDSFHPQTHPSLPTIELHGALRTLTCLTCHTHYPRSSFQSDLARLNPAWHEFLLTLLESGALDTEDPTERRKRGLRTNPDGDVDVPNAPYSTFRYPACPVCSGAKTVPNTPPHHARVYTDADGSWLPSSHGGILKPGVVMFGESISPFVKLEAEVAVDQASKILVIGSSLATYSAWRLVRRARERGALVGVLNLGGVRGEEGFFGAAEEGETGDVRISLGAEEVLPGVATEVEKALLANRQTEVDDTI